MSPHSHPGLRSAFTLLEIIIVLGILAAVVAGFTFHRSVTQRASLSVEVQALGLNACQILMAHLRADLENMVPGPLSSTFAEPVPRPAVGFDRLPPAVRSPDLPLTQDGRPFVEPVTYRFDTRDHRVYRNGVAIPAGPFENVSFTFFPSRPGDPTPPRGDVLRVECIVVPLEALGRVVEGTPRFRLRTDQALVAATVNHASEEWVSGP